MIGRIMIPPKDVHGLMPGTCELDLIWLKKKKKGFGAVIKNLQMGICWVIQGVLNPIRSKRKAEGGDMPQEVAT